MNWVLIIVIYASYSPKPVVVEGFTKEGCIAAAKKVRATQHRAHTSCVERK